MTDTPDIIERMKQRREGLDAFRRECLYHAYALCLDQTGDGSPDPYSWDGEADTKIQAVVATCEALSAEFKYQGEQAFDQYDAWQMAGTIIWMMAMNMPPDDVMELEVTPNSVAGHLLLEFSRIMAPRLYEWDAKDD